MAHSVSGNVTTVNALVSACNDVCAADGWTIDLFTTGRLHVHKGAYHYEIYAYTANNVGFVACTGYASGQTPPNQPGASPIGSTHIWVSESTYYQIISTGTNLLCFLYRTYSTVVNFCALGVIAEKVGSWTGGQFVLAGASSYSIPCQVWSIPNSLYVSINGSWTPNASFGTGCGLYATSTTLRGKMPSAFNAGLLRHPITVYLRNVSNSVLYHPIGYAPNIYSCRGGDVYLIGETIQIEGESHLFCGDTPTISTIATLLVKMEA